jgi:hypothetical protein
MVDRGRTAVARCAERRSIRRLALALGLLGAPVLAQDQVVVGAGGLRAFIDPARLAVTLDKGHLRQVATGGVDDLGTVRDLEEGQAHARWSLPAAGLAVEATARGGRLEMVVRRDEPGRIEWPRLTATPRGFVVPDFEGVYVGSDDRELMTWLAGRGAMSATADLSLPFLGFDHADRTLTWLFPDPYYVEVRVDDDPPRASSIHTWTPNRRNAAYEVVFVLGEPGPLAPAHAYRHWLQERGELVTLTEKIAANPAVERLLGAPHIYLWGSGYLSRHDVPRQRWVPFAAELLARAQDEPEGFVGRLVASLAAEGRQALGEIAKGQPYRYATTAAAAALSGALESPRLPAAPRDGSPLEVVAANASALAAAFSSDLGDPTRWGDGVSLPLLEALAGAGLERALLLTSDLEDARLKPHVAARTRELGWLFGPYDSYHSIHSPDAGPDETWATAQFDRELWETGGVRREDGTWSTGYRGRGRHLSPRAARPWVEKRVDAHLEVTPHSAWFVDCDAYGEFFDDYHEAHPATRGEDAAARRSRLRWLSAERGLVVGSEGASAVMTSAIHFGHGVTTPVIGWGDERLTNRNSPHFLGGYWPPDEPAVHFATVPLHPEYRRPYFDPRDRLPLHKAVFGDSVVTTHHWGFGSLKFADEEGTVELLELLYVVPPLYHLNRARWARDQERITRHLRFWSPLHRNLARAPLVEFTWLTDDRLVQRTTFDTGAGRVHLTVNFAGEARFAPEGARLPPRSATVSGPAASGERVYVVEE